MSTEMRRCECGKLPVVIKGRHNTLNTDVWYVTCGNEYCKVRPATANYERKHIAVSMWNNGVVTDSLI